MQVTASTSVLMILFSSSAISLSFYFQGLLNTSYAQILAPLCFLASLIGVDVHHNDDLQMPAPQYGTLWCRHAWQAQTSLVLHMLSERCECGASLEPQGFVDCTLSFTSAAGVTVVGRIIRRTGRASIIVLLLSVLIIIG